MHFFRERAPSVSPVGLTDRPTQAPPSLPGTRGVGPLGDSSGQTYQRFLAHREDGRVGLQVHPAAPPHRLQPLHCDVLGISQAQTDQVQHTWGGR